MAAYAVCGAVLRAFAKYYDGVVCLPYTGLLSYSHFVPCIKSSAKYSGVHTKRIWKVNTWTNCYSGCALDFGRNDPFNWVNEQDKRMKLTLLIKAN